MNGKRRRLSPPSLKNYDWAPWSPQGQQQQVQNYFFCLQKLEFLIYYSGAEEEVEMDWINCNLCCRQPGDEKERSFVLTSCGHLFCDLCFPKEPRDKCAACSSKCQLIQLSSKMKPDAEMFFQEPAALLRKHFNQINRLLEFQKDHRIRLVSFHRKMLQKYRSLEQQHSAATSQMQEMERRFSTATSRIQELENENQHLRSLIAQERGVVGGLVPSTPLEHQSRTLTPKNPSPKNQSWSPDPGKGRACGRGGSGPVPPSGPPPVPYGGAATSPVRYPSHTQPYHRPPHPHHILHDNQNVQPGVGYYLPYSPAEACSPSPARGSTGSLNQLSLPSQHHPSLAHKPPYPTQQPPYTHPQTSGHPQNFPPARPYSHGTLSSVLTSPDPFAKPHQGTMSYKKFGI